MEHKLQLVCLFCSEISETNTQAVNVIKITPWPMDKFEQTEPHGSWFLSTNEHIPSGKPKVMSHKKPRGQQTAANSRGHKQLRSISESRQARHALVRCTSGVFRPRLDRSSSTELYPGALLRERHGKAVPEAELLSPRHSPLDGIRNGARCRANAR